MPTWKNPRNWTNESYVNVADTARIFGNLMLVLERDNAVKVSQADKDRAKALQALQMNDIFYKQDYDFLCEKMTGFCTCYESFGGGFSFPNADKTALDSNLMNVLEKDIFLLQNYIMGGLM